MEASSRQALFFFVILLFCCDIGEAINTYYMDLNCGQTIYMTDFYAFKLKLTSYSFYNPGIKCTLTIQAHSSKRLMMYFRSRDILYDGACDLDWLEVHDGPSMNSTLVQGLENRICGYSLSSYVYMSANNHVTLYFHSMSGVHFHTGFEMMFTEFHTGVCQSHEHECDNLRCIDESTTCNGYNPCGDHSDCPLTGGAIAGIVIACAFVVFIIISLTVYCRIRRRRQRRQMYEECPTEILTTSLTHSPPKFYLETTNYAYNQPSEISQPSPPKGSFSKSGSDTPVQAYQ